MTITFYCNKCNNGTSLDRIDNSVRTCACVGNSPSCKPSKTNGSLGKRSTCSQDETVQPQKKQARHSDVVRDTVISMMDNWFLEENNILSESLDEQEEGYNRIISKLKGQLQAANRVAEIRSLQLMQSMRLIAMLHTWCPLVEEMFPGDVDELRAIHAHLNTELEHDVTVLTADTDTEE